MIDVGRIASLELPGLAENFALAFRHHQHSCHAQRVWGFEIACQILEHRRSRRVDTVAREEAFIDLRQRFRIEVRSGDVEHIFEVMMNVELLHHRIGVLARAVGEDQLAAGKFFQRGTECRIRRERRMVDPMHEVEIVVGTHAVFGHHSAHGRAVAPVIILLQAERFVFRDLQKIRDVGADALVHLLPEIEVMRIERVVEIEDPSFDIAEIARRLSGRCWHGVRVP